MPPILLPFARRYITLTLVFLGAVASLLAWRLIWPNSILLIVIFALALAATLLGLHDLFNARHSLLRNYPLAARMRFILEEIRPELRQYFFEDEKSGRPFSRDRRSLIYQRAKMQLDKRPFGSQLDIYSDGFEWITHSISAKRPGEAEFRITVGGPDCNQPYSTSVYNISAMSFGAISSNAVRAMNRGAAAGGFAQDTGEGGLSPYHLENGGDIIWEIGSGYFSARTPDGAFSPERFAANALRPEVKMVELKLSQGAKPGHGGVLPAAKISAEVSAIRGVPMGKDCISPPRHSAFATPIEMMHFIAKMRDLSGGKPAGFKLCIGHPWEFLAIVKAMMETGITPDFIVVDGKEGGTGAAPQEFLDHLGMPMREGLNFVHNALVGTGLRSRIKLGAAGKITSGFDIARAMALGADWCNTARGFMFAVGCVQSLTCHTDRCPTGVATQDPTRVRALVVEDKWQRVANFHRATLQVLAELTAAVGIDHPNEFRPEFFYRRVSPHEVRSFDQLYPSLAPGELLAGTNDPRFRHAWARASANSFQPQGI
jgi:glutamate synthase domain-containing protein 2